MILLGIAYTAVIFTGFPSPIEDEFRLPFIPRLEKTMHMIFDLPVLSWIGLKLHIGEWHGYYVIREPEIVAKIENLESAASLHFQIDSKGVVESVYISNESNREDFPKELKRSYPNLLDISNLLREFVLWYASVSDDKELLDEIIEELGMDSAS